MSTKVSFTIRRPSPATSSGADSDKPAIPRHLANDSSAPGSPLARSANASPRPTYSELDSSDEDDNVNDEFVTGFDRFGVQRCVSSDSQCRSDSQLTSAPFTYNLRKHEKKKPQGPLVIPALKDRDWRDIARKRKAINRYVPASAKAETGADGSVGGLGTRDTINSGPQLSGIQLKRKRVQAEEDEALQATEESVVRVEDEEETEDQKAMRAILASTNGGVVQDVPIVDMIPQRPVSETEAYLQDVQDFPDESTLDDYARVPVSQFGAALLRGMGWKEGAPTSAKGRKHVEPWLPTARPALLGIGAKEQEVFDDGSGKGKKNAGKVRPEKRYVPLVKKEREGTASGQTSRRHSPPSRRESAPASRRGSRSPSPRRRHRDTDRDSRRDDRRDYDRDRDRHTVRDGDRRERRDRRNY